jgi:DNA helicase-2/ATP-dependent DNA helicase PcrA
LCVVGDEDQSIYSWRGADITNILNFEKDFPNSLTVKLEENYRSSGTIVKAATAVIKNNSERKDKTLFTSNADGEQIQVREERSEYDEARYVVKSLQNLVEQGEANLSEIAIFYRTNAQSRVLEEQLRTSMVPYKIIGGMRFYERMEIKDIISYLKLVMNPTDDIAFKRVVNTPARGIGKTTIEKLEEYASQRKLSLTDALEPACEERLFNSGTTSKLRGFNAVMNDLRKLSKDHGLVDFYQLVLEKTEYLTKLQIEESVEAKSRIENLEELSNAMTQFTRERPDASLQTFLEEMALVSDIDSLDEEINSVTLMTLHVSKGLEYDYVFIVGLEDGLFPSGMAQDEDDKSEVEEERRLAYVGMTRARKRLWLTYAKSRKVWGQEQFHPPSRFLKEIPQNFVNFTTAAAPGGFVGRFTGNEYAQGKYNAPPKYRNEVEYQEFPDYDSEVSGSGNYQQGMKVRHPTFGVGSVYQVEGSGEMMKISVLFSDQTIKKFVAKYARLERV